MDDDYGPLRVVPGSHIDPITISVDEQKQPRPDELLVYPEAGDIVFTHNALIHSGTCNVSDKLRYFFSIYYNHSWLKHTDSHSGPNSQRIIAEARERGDQRVMRLLGADDNLQARANWGFLATEESRWSGWIDEDTSTSETD